MQKTFAHAILGGTFDHFHAGHRHFIQSAIAQSDHLFIGLSTEALYAHKPFANTIEAYTTREENIKRFVQSNGFLDNTKIIPLQDIYGNSLEKEDIDAIFVTPDTEITAQKINHDRQKKGWQPMQVIVVPLIKGLDGKVIASARIRKGEIDRQGNTYLSLFTKKEELHLPELLRDRLRMPLGEIIKTSQDIAIRQKNKMIISVGDIITASLQQMGIQPAISVFDLMSERKEITDKNIIDHLPKPHYVLENKSTTIQQDVVMTLQKTFDLYIQTREKQSIVIHGEEDLLTLPAILLSPLDAIVLYGQTNVGVIAVKITEEKKEEIKKIILQFV